MAPDIVLWPIAGVGGTCCIIADFALRRLIVLIEKFAMPEYLAALGKHRPPSVSLPSTVLRMMLDQKVLKESLGDLRFVFGGSSPMPVELQDAFEAEYGIPIIWAYGATEFCGTLTTWTPELYAKYNETKRGSIGRALPGVELRIVDSESGEILPRGAVGCIEARVSDIGDQWVRTTDLAMIDEDDFFYHRGRNDGAILRGGFKILPEKIDEALREHPAILDASTVAIRDRRLGQVPASAVELVKGASPPSIAELESHLRRRLTAPHIPVRFVVVDALPRTTSLKPSLEAVRQLFEAELSG